MGRIIRFPGANPPAGLHMVLAEEQVGRMPGRKSHLIYVYFCSDRVNRYNAYCGAPIEREALQAEAGPPDCPRCVKAWSRNRKKKPPKGLGGGFGEDLAHHLGDALTLPLGPVSEGRLSRQREDLSE